MFQETTNYADHDPAILWILILALFIIHFVPSIVAFVKGHDRRKLILLLNVLMGWTVIGWAVLLYWAIKGKNESTLL